MTGVEIDMVVSDSLKALDLYEKIFDTERIEVTSYSKGKNEAVFKIYGTRFHMLDENPDFMLVAPKPGDPKPMWCNVLVPNIRETFSKALDAGCTEVQPITELGDFGVINAIFIDPFGYMWLLHQIVREVSFEERCRIMEEKLGK
ncbi:VOC family protein [Candidatus Formimonas warabiya]|uniref:MerR family transcriptional regulator n=1 Tax=Formimonas warabiya TaxID=1761012 RepID=A0A3G1KWM8_FORW1|nr:VOC family protein [Candidatus Formimonas warabiya]ATW26820.1 MerR family transcriptional regulator [Candidatus Formimonas warabiya]